MADKEEKKEWTHFDRYGRAHMVSVEDKTPTKRRACAQGAIMCRPETVAMIRYGKAAKGDVLGTAQIAGIMAAKRTAEMVPMCHPLALTGVSLAFELGRSCVLCRAEVKTFGPTGVEIEALQAVETALLTIYDMVKAVDRTMEIIAIGLLSKEGGRSGENVWPGRCGLVCDVNISEKKGVIKTPVETGVLKVDHGLAGDAHAGSWHRQVSLLAQESIDVMRAQGVSLKNGDFAENITTSGIQWYLLPVGTRFAVGEAVLEMTQIGKQCHKSCAIKQQVGSCIMPTQGVFARVLVGGTIQRGDLIRILS